MAYTKQTWEDLPSKNTPINAARLNHMEDGIFNAAKKADDAVDGLDDKVDKVAGKGLSTNDYSNTDKGKVDNLGTAASKDSTNRVDAGSQALVESGAVYNAIETMYENVEDDIRVVNDRIDDFGLYVDSEGYVCQRIN